MERITHCEMLPDGRVLEHWIRWHETDPVEHFTQYRDEKMRSAIRQDIEAARACNASVWLFDAGEIASLLNELERRTQ